MSVNACCNSLANGQPRGSGKRDAVSAPRSLLRSFSQVKDFVIPIYFQCLDNKFTGAGGGGFEL